MPGSDSKVNLRKSLRILVVDSDPITQLIHHNRLQKKFNFPVITCTTAKEALDVLEKNPEYDYLVLLDIDLVEMSGWDFLEALPFLQMKPQGVYVIMVTCSVSSCDKRMAKNFSQVLDYFEKPLSDLHVQKISHLPKLIPYFISAN